MAVLKLVQSMTRVLANPPEVFQKEIRDHFQAHAKPLIDRLARQAAHRQVSTPSRS